MTTRLLAFRSRCPVVAALSLFVAALFGLVALTYALDGPIRDMIVNLTSLVLAFAAGSAAFRASRRTAGRPAAVGRR